MNNIKNYTLNEINNHNKIDDIWICINGKVYDVSKFIHKHPGQTNTLINFAGKDATIPFTLFHPEYVSKYMLHKYYIGDIVDYNETNLVSDFLNIRKHFIDIGLFNTNFYNYVILFLNLFTLLYFSINLSISYNDLYIKLFGAFLLGIYWQQISLIGHDIGHNSFTHNRKFDYLFGLIFINPTLGISLGSWKFTHNIHHIVTNSIENDPDIQHLPFIAIDEKELVPYKSSFHDKIFKLDNLSKFLISYQTYISYPLILIFGRFALFLNGIKQLISKKEIHYRYLDLIGILLFTFLYSVLVYYSSNSIKEGFLYILTSHCAAGIINIQIILSHFSMHTYSNNVNSSEDWIKMQINSSLNIKCHKIMNWFHGGLQYQIEHHLFPRLPRHHLEYASSYIKDFCKKHDLKYNNLNFIDANIKTLSHLNNISNSKKLS